MNRKFWALGILAAVCFFGCSEDDGNSTSTSGNSCNDGVLDVGEVCDGDKFAEGKRVCPAGKVLAAGKTESDITCSDKCAVVTEGVCVDAEEPKTCGNEKLDEGEVCDGDKFAEGKRVCPEGKVLAEGKTESDITCSDKCAVVTEGVCVDAEEPKTCGNEKLDEGEVCDGDKFAEGKRVCPEGKVLAEGKTESDITCSDKCALVTEGVCVDAGETKTCGNGKLDEGEICDGDKFAEGKRVCPDGLILASGKTEADIKCSETCTLDTGEACKPDVVQKCDGTKLCLCDGYEIDCICEDCAAKGETCDVVNGVAMCIGEKCTYDGSDKYICKGDFVVMCMADVEGQPEGHYLVEKNCAAEGQICSEEGSEAACVSEMCGEQDVDKAICKGSVRRICLATGDGSYAWLGEDCSEKGQICEDGECVDPPTCGNGFIDDGEKCDPNADPMIPSWLMADCYYYSKPNREDTTYEVLYKSGAPTCTQTCAITVNNCVKAVADDYTELKKWSFSSMNDITSATQSKIVVMHDIFGSGMSEFSDKPKGWSLGNWGKTAFAKWIEFKVGSISKNAVKVVVDVTRKNNSMSPEKFELRIQYKKGSETKTVTTHEVVFSDMETHQMTVLARGLTNASDLSVGFTAYGTDSDAHVVINNIVVSEIDAL